MFDSCLFSSVPVPKISDYFFSLVRIFTHESNIKSPLLRHETFEYDVENCNGFGGFVMNKQLLYFSAVVLMQGKKNLCLYILLLMYTKKDNNTQFVIHNSIFMCRINVCYTFRP